MLVGGSILQGKEKFAIWNDIRTTMFLMHIYNLEGYGYITVIPKPHCKPAGNWIP